MHGKLGKRGIFRCEAIFRRNVIGFYYACLAILRLKENVKTPFGGGRGNNSVWPNSKLTSEVSGFCIATAELPEADNVSDESDNGFYSQCSMPIWESMTFR